MWQFFWNRCKVVNNGQHLVNTVKECSIKELTCSVWVGDEAVLGRFFLRSTPAWPPTPPTPPPPPPLPPTPTPSTRWWCAWSSQPQFLCKLSCLWASAATASSFSEKVKGQLISKGHFVFFNSPKKTNENFLPKARATNSFFGKLKTLKFSFEINWPLESALHLISICYHRIRRYICTTLHTCQFFLSPFIYFFREVHLLSFILPLTLESGINIPLRLLIPWLFSRGYGFIPDFIEPI